MPNKQKFTPSAKSSFKDLNKSGDLSFEGREATKLACKLEARRSPDTVQQGTNFAKLLSGLALKKQKHAWPPNWPNTPYTPTDKDPLNTKLFGNQLTRKLSNDSTAGKLTGITNGKENSKNAQLSRWTQTVRLRTVQRQHRCKYLHQLTAALKNFSILSASISDLQRDGLAASQLASKKKRFID